MYLTFGRATVAIDAKTCRERWTYIWQPKGQEISPANRGAAIKDGKLVRGTADGYLIALDMADGSLLWSQPIASAAGGQYLSRCRRSSSATSSLSGLQAPISAPRTGSAPSSSRPARPVWKFNLIPDPGEPGAETWENPESLKHGGGSLWTPLSLDAKGRHRLSARRQSRARLLWRAQAWRQSLHRTRSWRSTPRPASSCGTGSSFPTTCTTPTSAR